MRAFQFAVASVCTLFLTVLPAAGQTISDGNAAFTFGTISGGTVRTSSNAGAGATLNVGGLTANALPQTWWWYRTDTPAAPDFREYALSNGSVSSTTPDSVGFTYIEPTPGGTALEFQLGYVIQDTTGSEARLLLSALITNTNPLLGATEDLTVYAFVDVDLPDASADTAMGNATSIKVSDSVDDAVIVPTGTPGLRIFEVADAATLTGELGNGVLESTFANGGLPYSGPNFSMVLKWTISGLPPQQSAVLGLNVLVNAAVLPCQGDIDQDGATNLNDLAALLSKFGMTGPGIPCDLDGNLVVDIADLTLLLSAFGC